MVTSSSRADSSPARSRSSQTWIWIVESVASAIEVVRPPRREPPLEIGVRAESDRGNVAPAGGSGRRASGRCRQALSFLETKGEQFGAFLIESLQESNEFRK